MAYILLADLIVFIHLAFVAFVVLGGLLVWRLAVGRLAPYSGRLLGRGNRVGGRDLPAHAL